MLQYTKYHLLLILQFETVTTLNQKKDTCNKKKNFPVFSLLPRKILHLISQEPSMTFQRLPNMTGWQTYWWSPSTRLLRTMRKIKNVRNPVRLYNIHLLVTNKFLCNPVRVVKMDCSFAVHTAIKIKTHILYYY